MRAGLLLATVASSGPIHAKIEFEVVDAVTKVWPSDRIGRFDHDRGALDAAVR